LGVWKGAKFEPRVNPWPRKNARRGRVEQDQEIVVAPRELVNGCVPIFAEFLILVASNQPRDKAADSGLVGV